jgi:hypothetical protein
MRTSEQQAPNTQTYDLVPEDMLGHKFKGGACFMNDRIALVIRLGAPGTELYSLESTGAKLRAVLSPGGFDSAQITSFNVSENSAATGAAEVFFSSNTSRMSIRRITYEIKTGQPLVQTEAPETTTVSHSGRGPTWLQTTWLQTNSLRVEAPCRFTVLPDFFADDIVVDAAELPPAQTELPTDNLILRLMPDQQAIVMTVAQNSEEDVRVWLKGEGAQRTLSRSELSYGKQGKIWVAVLSAPSIWHMEEIRKEQAGQVLPLDWKAPFPAVWRADWRRREGLTDSWQLLTEQPDGTFIKSAVFGQGDDAIPSDRTRWTTVLSWFYYPAWLDKEGRGYLQPFKDKPLTFEGPTVIYPLNRTRATGLNDLTPVDLIRNTLGVGPCEYVLDVEGQRSHWLGMATCGVRDTLDPIYAAHRQGQEKETIEKTLVDLVTFVKLIRGRIETYVAFGRQTSAYLEAQKQAHPELTDRLAELQRLAAVMEEKYAERKDKIQTPERVIAMVEDFRKNVLDCETDDAPAQCHKFTEAWVVIGDNQDELAGECRWATKMLRQRAGLMMAADPKMAEVAREVRLRSQKVLRSPAGHEGAAH